jgi:ribosomal protein S27AE
MMGMWRRGCQRCGGDVFEEQHIDGVDMVCLQCGHILTAAQESLLRAEAVLPGIKAQASKSSARQRTAVAA